MLTALGMLPACTTRVWMGKLLSQRARLPFARPRLGLALQNFSQNYDSIVELRGHLTVASGA
jgi:hypothetical protein